MKHVDYGKMEWSPWFRQLDSWEEEYCRELVAKLEQARDEVQHLTAELHRIRQRGMQRHRRLERLAAS
jgi:hypothetical protein